MSSRTQAIVLAAGRSSRFNTSATKLSFPICGQEMIRYPLDILQRLQLKAHVVVGYQQEIIREIIAKHSFGIECVEQVVQKGTGHALLCTKPYWTEDTLLVLNGDTPLIKQDHIEQLIEKHRSANAVVSFIATQTSDPSISGYGRVILDGARISIVEQKEFTGNLTDHYRLNAGVYLIERSFVEEVLPLLETHKNGEIYITDLIHLASERNLKVEIVDVPFDHVRGINTLKELTVAEKLVHADLMSAWMAKGVRFIEPESVIIEKDVTIGADTTIGYGVQLRKGTQIGKKVFIDAFSVLDGSIIGDSVTILSHSVITNSSIHSTAQVGPFARIQTSTLHPESVVGNFVEVSKTSLGYKSKAKHLTYLGQALIGKEVNIGAGTITCNYNGISKHPTTIEDHAFIGSNSALLAPVTIGSEAIVAAGSVITESVPSQALAIARQRQTTKLHYAALMKAKKQEPGSIDKVTVKPTTQGS